MSSASRKSRQDVTLRMLPQSGCVPWFIEASNQKVAKLRFDSGCGSASLRPWERHLMLFPILGPSSLPAVVA